MFALIASIVVSIVGFHLEFWELMMPHYFPVDIISFFQMTNLTPFIPNTWNVRTIYKPKYTHSVIFGDFTMKTIPPSPKLHLDLTQ